MEKCTTCGKRNRSKSFKQCKHCREVGAARSKRRYSRHKRNERCVRCGTKRKSKSRSYCKKCLAYLSNYW